MQLQHHQEVYGLEHAHRLLLDIQFYPLINHEKLHEIHAS